MHQYDGRTDEDVMEAYYEGDKLAFDELDLDRGYREHLAFRAFFRLGACVPWKPEKSRRDMAEECAHTALVQAQATRNRTSGRWQRESGCVRPWMDVILDHVVVDVLRKEQRRREHEQHATDMAETPSDGDMSGVLGGAPGREMPPDRQAEREEVKREMRLCVDGLPEPYRTVVLLRVWEGKTLEEVAVILGVSTTKVFRLEKNALVLLGECLKRKQIEAAE
jgi:RNA polymerase sigma factor (sigma-70 family)